MRARILENYDTASFASEPRAPHFSIPNDRNWKSHIKVFHLSVFWMSAASYSRLRKSRLCTSRRRARQCQKYCSHWWSEPYSWLFQSRLVSWATPSGCSWSRSRLKFVVRSAISLFELLFYWHCMLARSSVCFQSVSWSSTQIDFEEKKVQATQVQTFTLISSSEEVRVTFPT